MKRVDYKTISLGMFTLLIVCSFFYQSFSLQNGSGSTGVVSPAAIPRVVIVLIALVGGVCVWMESRNGEQKECGNGEGKKIICSMLLMAVVVVFLEIIGFLAGGILFLTGQILLTGGGKTDQKQLRKTVLLAVACSVAMVVIFRYGFHIGISILPPVF